MFIIDFFLGLDNLGKFVAVLTVVYALCAVVGLIMRLTGRATINSLRRTNAAAGRSAVEVTRKMLNENGQNHVLIQRSDAKLTNFFDPVDNSIKLEQKIHASPTVGAIAIACHEAGHAVKFSEEKDFGVMRVKLLPILKMTNRLIFPTFAAGLILYCIFYGSKTVMDTVGLAFIFISLLLFLGAFFYALISLPMELDASKRANAYLKSQKVLNESELSEARKALNALKLTYITEMFYSPLAGPGFLIWLFFIPKD